MKKLITVAVAVMFTLLQTGCGTEIEQKINSDMVSTVSQSITDKENSSEKISEQPNEKSSSLSEKSEVKVMENSFLYTEAKNPENQVSIKITTGIEDADKIKIYFCKADSSDKQNIQSQLVGEFDTASLPGDNIVTVKVNKNGNFTKIAKDNSKVQVDFSSCGYKICGEKAGQILWYEYKPCEVTIDTGTIYQYNADFEGLTACGASNGVLVIQPASPLWNKDLLDRFNAVRNYSKLSTKYSGGEKMEYCMVGDQVVNSVNDYLSEKGITDFSVANFDYLSTQADELARQLVNTGRPAMFDVQYQYGKIRKKSPYSHWITVNGYKISADGKSYKLRWENTIEPVNSQWIGSDLFNKAVQGTVDNRDFSYYNLTEEDVVKLCGEIKRNIVALKDPLVNSFIE